MLEDQCAWAVPAGFTAAEKDNQAQSVRGGAGWGGRLGLGKVRRPFKCSFWIRLGEDLLGGTFGG